MSRVPLARGWGGSALAAVLACALGSGAPAAQGGGRPLGTHVDVTPSAVRLGEHVTYRAIVTGCGTGSRIRILPPVSAGDLTWGLALGRHRVATGERTRPDARGWYATSGVGDSLVMEVPLQVFRPGMVSIPGPRVQIVDPSGARDLNLPTVTLVVVPTIGSNDSTADLRPLRGPMPAPWWERVPWGWVALGLLGLGAAVALTKWRRRRPVVARRAAGAPRAARDPLVEGLAALAALRAEGLPAAGRFAEHAFRLTLITRRFLESAEGTPRPGDTSTELVGRLESGRLARPDLDRLAGLLSRWDRVKFARAATTPAEATQAEEAVESLMRRLVPRPQGKAA